MDDNCPASIQQIQKIISPLNKCIKNMKDNKDIYLENEPFDSHTTLKIL